MAVDSGARGLALKAKQDLATYYYTKSEVDAIVAGIHDPIIVTELPTASEQTRGKLYMVGPKGTAPNVYYEEWLTIRRGEEGSYTYTWESIGSTGAMVKDIQVNGTTILDAATGIANVQLKTINNQTIEGTGNINAYTVTIM